MPRWIHARAKHILAKNPDMDKSQAFAIATQQSHATGKSPKGYGTEEGKSEAKSKYQDPKSMVKKPNPGNLKTPKLAAATPSLRPSPMWSSVGGSASRSPAWRSQAGFTPPGMKTPAQKLKKSMNTAKFDPNKGLKPVDIKVATVDTMRLNPKPTTKSFRAVAPDPSFRPKTAAEDPKGSSGGKRVALGLAGDVASGGVTYGLSKLMERAVDKEKAMEGAGDLVDRVAKGSKTPVSFDDVVDNGAFIPDMGRRGAGKVHVNPKFKVPSVVAHELGHASIDANRAGRIVQHPFYNLSRAARPLAGFGAGLATGASEDKRVRMAGVLAPAALHLPELGYEAGASILGLRNLRRSGTSRKQLLAAAKGLAPAFGTYLGMTGSTVAAGGVGSGIARLIDEEDGQPKKVAFQMSQYAGASGLPPMRYASGIPAWREPPVKTAGPPPQKVNEDGITTRRGKTAGVLKRANIASPASQLAKNQQVGAPRLTAPPGPSIAQISKPVGFGKPMSGATKGVHSI